MAEKKNDTTKSQGASKKTTAKSTATKTAAKSSTAKSAKKATASKASCSSSRAPLSVQVHSDGDVTIKRDKKKVHVGRNIVISVVALVLVVAIAVGVLYLAFPETFWQGYNGIASLFKKDDNQNNTGANLALGENELRIHFIDVGQGDCILIQLPDGKEMLIDCANYNGGNAYRDSTLNYLSNYITDGQIDYLMLTHCDSDHVYYLDDVLNAYQVDNIYMPNVLSEPSDTTLASTVSALNSTKLDWFKDVDTISSGVYADFFIAALNEPNCIIRLNVGDFEIATSVYSLKFYCYDQVDWDDTDLSSAEEKNAISPIGILTYNNKRVVLTGDSNEINEPKVMSKIGGTLFDCDLLKVGHHGSGSSSTAAFLDFIDCETAVISCNKSGNTFKHPRQETLDRLKVRDMNVYRTDLNGTVVASITLDGMTVAPTKAADKIAVFTGADATAA